MLSPAKALGQAVLPPAAAVPPAAGHPRPARSPRPRSRSCRTNRDGGPAACSTQDCTPASQRWLASGKHLPASSAVCDGAAAVHDQAAPAGPRPAAYAGPPRVADAEDQPLAASWVDERAPHLVDALRNEGRSVVLVKSSVDNRYARSWVVTHDGRRARCYAASSLREFAEAMGPNLDRFDAVAVDEAQFFPDLLEFALEQAEGAGRHVLVAGLALDFRRRSFGDVVHLVPHATRVQRLTADCFYCSSPAAYTVRIAGAGDGVQTLVGGSDCYRPACTRCYRECTAAQTA